MAAWCKYAERQEEQFSPILCNRNKKDSVKDICAGQKFCKRTNQCEMSDRVRLACKYYKTK